MLPLPFILNYYCHRERKQEMSPLADGQDLLMLGYGAVHRENLIIAVVRNGGRIEK
jgi:hypothetical protein